MAEYTTRSLVEGRLGCPAFTASTVPTSSEVDTLITQYSAFADEVYELAVEWSQATYVDELQDVIKGFDRVYLKNTPVISITSVERLRDDNTWETLVEGRTTDADWFFDDADDGRITFEGYYFGYYRRKGLKINYSAGHATIPVTVQTYTTALVAIQVARIILLDKDQPDYARENLRPLIKSMEDEIRRLEPYVKAKKISVRGLV